ncbi:MAG: hypothetical protein HOP16_21215 [Acidobacteria bacterium]|nr:hypothetical protein [Acidobacteriota bacterium]
MATCPECEFDEVDTSDFEEGDAVNCPECGKSLVVAANGDLDYADDEDDDLDDDDDDEDEEEEEVEDEDVIDDDEDAVDDEEDE